jgi:hypothetical protein
MPSPTAEEIPISLASLLNGLQLRLVEQRPPVVEAQPAPAQGLVESTMSTLAEQAPGLSEIRLGDGGATLSGVMRDLALAMDGMSDAMMRTRETASTSADAGPASGLSAAMGAMMNMMAASSLRSDASSEASPGASEIPSLTKRVMSGDQSAVEPYKAARRRAFEFELESEVAMLTDPKVGGALAGIASKIGGEQQPKPLAPHERVD